jgi:hypothetical protein
VWSCDTCGRPNKSNPLICETCGASAPGADPDVVSWALQRDLPMEAHLRALAFWYRVGAVLMVVLGAAMFAFVGWIGKSVLADTTSWRGPGAMVAGAIGYLGFLIVAAAVGSFVLGHFLGRFANGARLAAAILTIVGLAATALRFVMTAVVYSRVSDLGVYGEYAQPSLAGPIASLVLSTVWMIAIAWTLFSSRAAQVCAPAYRTIVARTAGMTAPMHKSPFFVVPHVGTILVVLIGVMVFVRLHAVAMY